MNQSILIYFFIIVIATILCFIAEKKIDSRISKFLFLCSFFIVFLFSGLRYNVGTDFGMYEEIFVYSHSSSIIRLAEIYDMEIGWIILNKLSSLIGNDPQIIFLVSSFIIIGNFYIFIFNHKDNINIGLSIFIFLTIFLIPSFNGIRQFMAMSILLYSFDYMKKKSFLKFLVVVFIASLFHATSLIMLPIYFLFKYKFSFKLYLLISVLTSIIFLYNSILEFIVSHFPQFEKFERYISDGILYINYIELIYILVLTICFCIYRKFIRSQDSYVYNYFYLYFISIFFTTFSYFTTYAVRLSYYFLFSHLVLAPFIVKKQTKRYNKYILLTAFILYYSFYFFYYFIYLGHHQAIPYTIKV